MSAHPVWARFGIVNIAIAAAALALALLSFFYFPGHTWLQQDTQIYVPILDHIDNPAVLDGDLLTQYPHVSYTLYDELTLGLRHLTGLDLEHVLGGLQILCRAFGIWGIYCLAIAAGIDTWAALLTAALFSLGAMIAGPSVLIFEYEPTPRALAIPLVFCSIGLVVERRFTLSAFLAAAAFLIHAPSTAPFWLALLFILKRDGRRTLPVWISLAVALAILIISEHLHPVVREQQEFFARLTPEQESVQRMRAAYNWISVWWRDLLGQYVLLWGLGMLALWRVWRDLPSEFRTFAVMLPALGMLSMPISYVLLEQLKWALVPQLQPMRVLLFVTAFTVILATLAAIKASRLMESAAWFLLVFYIPMRVQLFDPPTPRVLLTAIGLATFAAVALRLPRPALLIAGMLAFFIIPGIGQVKDYPNLHTAEIADLARWARSNTPPNAVFLFPDAGHLVYPGIFRATAQRVVYVDWKSGGQVNYLKDFAREWDQRWTWLNHTKDYRGHGIDYLVYRTEHAASNAVYRNRTYAVYRISQ